MIAIRTWFVLAVARIPRTLRYVIPLARHAEMNT